MAKGGLSWDGWKSAREKVGWLYFDIYQSEWQDSIPLRGLGRAGFKQ
jgi:hypothetical protein